MAKQMKRVKFLFIIIFIANIIAAIFLFFAFVMKFYYVYSIFINRHNPAGSLGSLNVNFDITCKHGSFFRSELRLQEDTLGEDALHQMSETDFMSISAIDGLRLIELNDFVLSQKIFNTISKCRYLEELLLYGCKFDSKSLENLSRCKYIETVYICFSEKSTDHKDIIYTLRHNKSIKRLTLSNACLSLNDLRGLKQLNQLKHLYLNCIFENEQAKIAFNEYIECNSAKMEIMYGGVLAQPVVVQSVSSDLKSPDTDLDFGEKSEDAPLDKSEPSR